MAVKIRMRNPNTSPSPMIKTSYLMVSDGEDSDRRAPPSAKKPRISTSRHESKEERFKVIVPCMSLNTAKVRNAEITAGSPINKGILMPNKDRNKDRTAINSMEYFHGGALNRYFSRDSSLLVFMIVCSIFSLFPL